LAEKKVPEITMTPMIATVIFVLACLCGVQYRRVWKAEGPRLQLWIFGILAGAGLLILGFVPMAPV
jgi:4-amino-4-deoxy-L-arabinose transferase-like glycosyltransferase